jgi:hypothetical protein
MFAKVLGVKDHRPLLTELALRARATSSEPQEVLDTLTADIMIQLNTSAVSAEVLAVEALFNVAESVLFPADLFTVR